LSIGDALTLDVDLEVVPQVWIDELTVAVGVLAPVCDCALDATHKDRIS